ncbi:major facilitator superfamily domain-containing protein [Mortierella sp. GBAus27b]|nr:hypothetical protein BGX31_003284 [Mortierella sp. GBA43]KAI8351886.1 major facilitator superfamily domain-containing protein [Mortierella sp. GBAus27b]
MEGAPRGTVDDTNQSVPSYQTSTPDHCKTIEEESTIPQLDDTPMDSSEIYPEGGYGLIVLGATFVIAFWAVGVAFDWGVFEAFLNRTTPFHGSDSSHLCWVGGISSASLFIAGPAIVFLINKLGTKTVLAAGTIFMTAGYVIGSFAQEYWHLYITNGFMFGFGGCLQYLTAMNVLAGYFNKKRGLAVGVAMAGSGIGASALAPLMRWMAAEVDFRWTFRIIGGCIFLFTGIAMCVIKPYNSGQATPCVQDENTNLEKGEGTGGRSSSDISRTSATAITSPSRSHTQKRTQSSQGALDFTILRIPGYALVFVSTILCAFTFMVPILMVPSYATSIGLSAADGATMLTITSSVNVVF